MIESVAAGVRRALNRCGRAAGVGAVAVLVVAGCSDSNAPATAGTRGEAPVGEEGALEPAPDFDLRRLGGGRVQLADLRGRIVIVDFWATWCPPCEFQVPGLNAFLAAHRDEGDVEVFGVSVDTVGEDVVGDWVIEKGVDYPILLGGERLARDIGALGFPTLLIITPEGRIDSQHVGLIEIETLEAALVRLRGAEVPAS